MKRKLVLTACLACLVSGIFSQNDSSNSVKSKTAKELKELTDKTPLPDSCEKKIESILYEKNFKLDSLKSEYPKEFNAFLSKYMSIKKIYDEMKAQELKDSKEDIKRLERLKVMKETVNLTPSQEQEVKKILLTPLKPVPQDAPETLNEEKIQALNNNMLLKEINMLLKTILNEDQIKVLTENNFFEADKKYEKLAKNKVIETGKYVKLTPEEEIVMTEAARDYYLKVDSAIINPNLTLADSLKSDASRIYFEKLMSVLDVNRQNTYLENISANAAKKRTAVKIGYLRDSGKFDEAQLAEAEKSIFIYLLTEYMIKNRYKYNTEELNKNLVEIKKTEPKASKQAGVLEKLQQQGKEYRGTYQW